MRVASVNQDPGIAPGRKKGAAVHLAAMRRAFAGHGAEVITVDEREGREVALRLEEASLPGPIDLIYERLSLGATAAVTFARERSIPYVVEVNAPLLEEAVRWRGEVDTADLRAAEELGLGSAAVVIAVSSEVARYAVERGAEPSRVHVFPNGVDLQEFHPGLRTKVRASLVPEGRFVLGFHGRLRPWHGFDRLVEVFGDLLEREEPVHLVLVGEGQLDGQTAFGKVPVGVARLASGAGIPVVAIAGSLGVGSEAVHAEGITACFSIADGPMQLEDAFDRAPKLLARAAEQVVRLFVRGQNRTGISP